MASELTRIVKHYESRIRSILSSDKTVIEKTVELRIFAREIASKYFERMHYKNIDDFYFDYKNGRSPITALEGEGIVAGEILILKKCPMAALLNDFKVEDSFPDYWTSLPIEFMEKMKNEAILHPLCIVHQSFRDELAKQIPKGASFVHSIAVACRSGANGKVVYSEFGIMMSGVTKDEIDRHIDGMACAFYVK
ncbi:MAG: hypothetical protein JSV21_01860 [Nitrospirota bacterium]|nr:MAG: hypothetical protein JSV21_01860 [Nitrospirota bacterium]